MWLLGTAQRRLDRPMRSPAPARAAFAAFVAQAHVLVALALLVRPVAAPAEVKALFVGVAGVALCFGAGHLLTAARRAGRAAAPSQPEPS